MSIRLLFYWPVADLAGARLLACPDRLGGRADEGTLMAGPAWLAEIFAGIMLATAVYCASRLVISRTRRRPTERDVDLVHVIMGVAMAGMLVPHASPLWSGTLWGGAWATVFGASAAWFAWRVGQGYRLTGRLSPSGRHHLPHLIMCGAMVYMLLAAPRPGAGALAMGGLAGGAGRFPVLALLLAQFMVGYAIWTIDRLPALAPVRARAPGGPSPAARFSHAAGAQASNAAENSQITNAQPGQHVAAAGGQASWEPGPPPLSPRLAACCNVAMGIVMGYLLVTLL
jgi:hypothetical protein